MTTDSFPYDQTVRTSQISARQGRLSDLVTGAAIALTALALRLIYWLVLTPGRPLTSDAFQYSFLATNLAEGKGYVDVYPQLALHATAFRPPAYPALLAVAYWLFGAHPGVGRALNVVIGTAVVFVAFVVVRRHVGRWAAVGTAVALAVSPNLIANDTFTLSDPLALLILLLLVDSLLRRRWVLAGVLTGALILTRPSAQYLAVVLAIWVLYSIDWRRALAYLAIVGLVVAPWVIRNWVQLGSPVLVTSNGYNWSAMYSPPAQEAGGFVDPLNNHWFDSMRLYQFNEVLWDRHLTEIGQRNARHHPGLFLHVASRNAAAFFEVDPSLNRGAEAEDGRSLATRNDTLWVFYVTAGVGLVGLWIGRRRRMTQLMVLIGAYFTLASLVFIAAPRLRAPVDLVFALGVGLAVEKVTARRVGQSPDRQLVTRT